LNSEIHSHNKSDASDISRRAALVRIAGCSLSLPIVSDLAHACFGKDTADTVLESKSSPGASESFSPVNQDDDFLLTRVIEDLALLPPSALEAIAVSSPSLLLACSLISSFRKEHDSTALVWSDDELRSPSGEHFRNIGVQHTEGQFHQAYNKIKEAVSKSDIVLLESISQEHGGGFSFFHRVADIAYEQGKEIYDIDRSRFESGQMMATLAGVVGPVVGYHLLKSRLQYFGRAIPPTEAVNRLFYHAIGWGGSSAFGFPTPRMIYQTLHHPEDITLTNPEQYGKLKDFGYIFDGRTVMMLGHVLCIAKENPSKSVLVITGNGHALGISYYLSNEARFQSFQRRNRIYRASYGVLFGRKATPFPSERLQRLYDTLTKEIHAGS